MWGLFEGCVVGDEEDGDVEEGEGADEGVAEGEEGEGVDEEHDVAELVEAVAGHDVAEGDREDDRDDKDGVELHSGMVRDAGERGVVTEVVALLPPSLFESKEGTVHCGDVGWLGERAEV